MKKSFEPRLELFCLLSLLVAVGAPLLAGTALGLDAVVEPRFQVDGSAIIRDNRTENSYAPIVKKAAPSVVNIYSTRTLNLRQRHPIFDDPMLRQFFGDDGNPTPPSRRQRAPQEKGLGSGVIVSADGYILTANHVIDGADADGVKVALTDGGKEFAAKVVGTDSATDIAVLKVDAKELPAITIADSDKLEVGDVVLAIGNPFGVGQTVTKGIVSALSRNSLGINEYENFIQTDAAINQGNSGGALVDSRGRLVGINTLIFSRSGGFQGVGFAVPSNLARSVLERLVKSGKVTRGYIGVRLQPEITDELAEAFNLPDHSGAMITEVNPDTAAGAAGLKSGDIIREVDGRKIADSRELRLTISQMAPGTKTTLTVWRSESGRKGVEKKMIVTLGAMPEQFAADSQPAKPGAEGDPHGDALDGVEVTDLTPEVRQQYKSGRNISGALVSSVDEDSNSAKAGLRQGDVILEINHATVRTADDAVEFSKRASGRRVLLRIWRDGGVFFLTVDNQKRK